MRRQPYVNFGNHTEILHNENLNLHMTRLKEKNCNHMRTDQFGAK